MAGCWAFLVLIWVAGPQMSSSYIIDEAYSGDGNEDLVIEAQNTTDSEDEPYKQSDQVLLKRLQRFIRRKNLKEECTEDAKEKTRHLLKEREEKDKTMISKSYQILQHGEESIASNEEWLLAIRSEICAGCAVKKICNHPPKFLSKYVSRSLWKSLAPVVQRVYNAIHLINHYPVDSVVCFLNTYPLDSDLSGGERYPPFK